MKILFFNKKFKLSNTQSEILKVAILDSIKQAEFDKAQFSESDKEFIAIQNKLVALNDLADKLGLVHD